MKYMDNNIKAFDFKHMKEFCLYHNKKSDFFEKIIYKHNEIECIRINDWGDPDSIHCLITCFSIVKSKFIHDFLIGIHPLEDFEIYMYYKDKILKTIATVKKISFRKELENIRELKITQNLKSFYGIFDVLLKFYIPFDFIFCKKKNDFVRDYRSPELKQKLEYQGIQW